MKKRIDTFWRYRNLLFELVKNKKEKMEIKERGKFDWEKNERFHVKIIFAT